MFSLVNLHQDLLEIVNALQQLNHYADQGRSVSWVEMSPGHRLLSSLCTALVC